MAVITRLAASAPAAVFLAGAHGSAGVRHAIRADPRITLVRSPRHATVLVVAGRIPSADGAALLQVHDLVPRPRAVVTSGASGVPAEIVVTADPAHDKLMNEIVRLSGAALAGEVDTANTLPDDNPVEWRGVGPHGTGGEGMMGGVPYGRPMAMTAMGRDGLELDRLDLVLGPWLPGLPAGIQLEVGLQGDVFETVKVRTTGLSDPPPNGQVPVAGIERLRARVLLGWLADLVDLAGFPAEAVRLSRLALAPNAADIRRARRRLSRPWSLRLATDGVGTLDRELMSGRGLGWLARSAGIDEDERRVDPAYAGLDIPTVPTRGGDVTARWQTWLDEAETAVRLASAAGPERLTDCPELPWGPGRQEEEERRAWRARVLGDLLQGAEVGRALLTVASMPGAADAEQLLLGGVPA